MDIKPIEEGQLIDWGLSFDSNLSRSVNLNITNS